MRFGWIGVSVLVLAVGANAQITRTATFENYTPGQELYSSFTDTASAISFTNPTGPGDDFEIAFGIPEFGSGNYLGSGSPRGWPWEFGFTGKVPAPADQVSLEISCGIGSQTSYLTLEGFDASNSIVAEQSGAASEPNPFTLQITSPEYDITSFQVIATGNFTAYDNISYTILPEPVGLGFFVIVGIGIRRRKCPRRSSTALATG